MTSIFTRILHIELPETVTCDASRTNPAFRITFLADGKIPYPQIILHAQNGQHIIKGDLIEESSDPFASDLPAGVQYVATVPAGLLRAGDVSVQVEGCRKAELRRAGGEDWIKEFRSIRIDLATTADKAEKPAPRIVARAAITPGTFDPEPKIYFGIHKHMHQPYYQAADPSYWDGEKEEIFGSRGGPYTDFVPAAVRQYIDGGLPHAGLSCSWSGSLVEQINRCEKEGLCGGRFGNWTAELRAVAKEKTALGNPRMDIAAIGFFHPLMALTPARNIVRQIRLHRDLVRDTFGVEASTVLFPPETAFHARMIPALNEAGVSAVMYDSIHRFRACRDYPYNGINEGMLPPNLADHQNPPAQDWMWLHNIWVGSQIAPSLLKPEYVRYEDPMGEVHKIIAVPAERYIGNEDARGGFGALQYPDVLGQVYDQIVATGTFDPRHPPFFLLHSDGDNHGGGADSYYYHNTGELVRWLQGDPRFELITTRDYLQLFPPDPDKAAHIEGGSWSGADNGDPQFMKWFSRYNEPYSPDLNSWAILTALQSIVHSLEDADPGNSNLEQAARLMLTAETSCYWYWTGQDVWDSQVTWAANAAHSLISTDIDALIASGKDRAAPAIFPPWVTPENPGGKKWGQGCLLDAPREATAHTFIHDISGIARVSLILRAGKGEQTIAMRDHGPYPSQTGPAVIANYYTAQLPVGAGHVRYFIEAEDKKGNVARGSLEGIYLA
uniref:Glycosyl hydrolase family 57 n=1 Tax=Candidatus Kentrum sp. UNK TaxID=2126344 RepID=A0A451AXX6_9GAMM|nr:MAG: Glycosyl hydrolase family 57 [Candidatus Kentron sp. UNK]VFK70895.1 MAG: Glycosyl hydrolase family 57 [Candidatus Kentron sp. UNK]